jgi:ParB family chromosome partitioning protein
MEQRKVRDRGLGRGLDALFGDEETTTIVQEEPTAPASTSGRKLIGIEQIYPNPDQPRRHFDKEAILELAQSIKNYGLLQPILVRPKQSAQGNYEIVAGERRWRAAQQAQLHEIPVIIRELDDEQTYQIALVENLQRKDLDPIEEAQGYQKLVDDFDETPESVGKVVGKSRSHVTNMMRLLALPDSVIEMIQVGDLSAGHARALLGSEHAFKLAVRVIKENLSVRATEKLVADETGRDIQKRSFSKNPKPKGFAEKDADLLALEKQLSDSLGLNATFDMKTESKGSIKIEFKDLDQLDDVLKKLTA